MEIEYAKGAKEKINERKISQEQVKEIIEYGEQKKQKLYAPAENRYLSKKEFKEAIVYVEYSPGAEKDTYVVHTAYSHRAKLKEGG